MKSKKKNRRPDMASRRKFVKTAALGVTALGLGALTGCDDDSKESSAPCPDVMEEDLTAAEDILMDQGLAWDEEADVIVVGSGCGLVAALAAAVSKAKVLVLEKSEQTGGSTRLSGGVIWIPGNHVLQSEGTEDPRDKALAYVEKVARGQAPLELLEAFVDRGPEMAAFVQNNSNFKWRSSIFLGDYHPEWEGAIAKGRSIEPDLEGPFMELGPQLVGAIEDGAVAAGAEIRTQTPVTRLVTRLLEDGRQEVLGVEAQSDGATVRIKGNRAVVLAAGGYDWDMELKKHFLRGTSMFTLGHTGNTGDGLKMAMSAGADLRNMNECWGGIVFAEEAGAAAAEGKGANLKAMAQRRSPGCITVNRHGQRFHNEAAPYDPSWAAFMGAENFGDLLDRNLPAFHISDKKVKPSADSGVHQADTVAELAEKLGIDPDGLEAAVMQFNENALLGADPLFHRGESEYDTMYGPTLAPLDKPPYYGVQVAPADLGTCGGARVNENAQVLTPLGEILPRLYAAGNSSGVGGPGAGYGGGGGTIGPAFTFAYIAGVHAADLDGHDA